MTPKVHAGIVNGSEGRHRMTHGVESMFGYGITFEELWDIDFESIASKVVGEELTALISKLNRLRG